MHGSGVYTCSKGHKYDGEYKAHKREGQGTFIWADGEKYEGQWKGGLKHGPGMYFWTDKSISPNPMKATWDNDVLQRSQNA